MFLEEDRSPQDRKATAVFTHHLCLKGRVLPACCYLLERTLEELRVFWNSDPLPGQRSAVYLFSGIAAHLKKRLIGLHDHFFFPLVGNNPDNIGVEESANALLALAQ